MLGIQLFPARSPTSIAIPCDLVYNSNYNKKRFNMVNGIYDTIKSHIDNFETQLFTSLPATVLSWNSEEQTISARPVMLEPYTDGDVSKLPTINDIPVTFPSAGGGSLTFPIKIGDEVLLVFSARNYDSWWETGEVDSLSTTQRFHEITDAIAILGLTSKNKSVKANVEDVELKFNDNSIQLKKDGTIEVVTKDTISITNSNEELVNVLSDALQAIADITTKTQYGFSPIVNKSDVLAVKQRLDTFKK